MLGDALSIHFLIVTIGLCGSSNFIFKISVPSFNILETKCILEIEGTDRPEDNKSLH